MRRLIRACVGLGAIVAALAVDPALAQVGGAESDAAGTGGGRLIGAEPVVQPQVERRELEEPHIDAEDIEIGVFVGLLSVEDFGANLMTGARLAYHVTEDFFVEASIGRADTEPTSYERLSGSVSLLTDAERRYGYYNLSLGYNLLPGESFIGRDRAYNSDMYVIGGIGATRFAGDNRFTWNLGAGYRVLLTDWLGIEAEVRDHIFRIDVTGVDKLTHNIEIHGGITVFF
jgi:outer membrane beta-barrel protein